MCVCVCVRIVLSCLWKWYGDIFYYSFWDLQREKRCVKGELYPWNNTGVRKYEILDFVTLAEREGTRNPEEMKIYHSVT